MAESILAFKAGRAYRRDGTNFLDPNPTKGAIMLSRGDDELLHFLWKNRANEQIEEVRLCPYYRWAQSQVWSVGPNIVPYRCYL